jgi:S-adenosylmethionine decarboxylase
MDLEDPGTTHEEVFQTGTVVPFPHDATADSELPADHFIVKNGVACAGSHLIIDLEGAEGLSDIDLIDKAMRECVTEAGATLLHIHLHPFTPEGVSGVSGVAVLAESHISIHTWPERNFAALDVFMCGDAQPEKCIEVLKRHFRPSNVNVTELLRGAGQ